MKEAFIEGIYRLVNPFRQSSFDLYDIEEFDIMTEEEIERLVWSDTIDNLYGTISEYERGRKDNTSQCVYCGKTIYIGEETCSCCEEELSLGERDE